MLNKSLLLLIFALTLLLGCTKVSFDSKAELFSFLKVESNGYMQNKNVNGINFSLMYKPTDLLVSQELGDSITPKRVEDLRKKYGKYLYFNLSMSRNNKELLSETPRDRGEFSVLVNQLAFRMDDIVHLYSSTNDTIEMIDFVYPRLYGMGSSTNIMFVFPRDKEKLKDEYFNFTIEDFNLFTGEVKFRIETEKINKEPLLSFNH